jgi:hypothetical protein
MVSYDEKDVLSAWDIKAEDRKVAFLDKLYFFYEPASRTYSGLTQRFAQDVQDYFRRLGRFMDEAESTKFSDFLLTLK